MNKKLTKHGNSLALIIDKPILKLLNINESTPLEITIEDNTLMIRPSRKSKKTKNKSDLKKIAHEIMEEYREVFEKLAK